MYRAECNGQLFGSHPYERIQTSKQSHISTTGYVHAYMCTVHHYLSYICMQTYSNAHKITRRATAFLESRPPIPYYKTRWHVSSLFGCDGTVESDKSWHAREDLQVTTKSNYQPQQQRAEIRNLYK